VSSIKIKSFQVKLQHGLQPSAVAVHNNAKVAILFSGGVDSMVLAALGDMQLSKYSYLIGCFIIGWS